jgi:hypothetical protein
VDGRVGGTGFEIAEAGDVCVWVGVGDGVWHGKMVGGFGALHCGMDGVLSLLHLWWSALLSAWLFYLQSGLYKSCMAGARYRALVKSV